MADDIRITPGGFITSKPRHMLGEHGASPFLTSPFTIEGFQNLINRYGSIAWPLFNSTGDTLARTVTAWLGNDTFGGIDLTDMVTQNVMSRVVRQELGHNNYLVYLDVNGEFAYKTTATTSSWTVGSEPFTTAGTVTLTAGSNIVVGAGSAWNTDVLTGPYGLTPSVNQIVRGDVLMVLVSANRWFAFRIVERTDNTHLVVWPTPSALNPALGGGKTYKIIRTGYNSYSNVEGFNVPDGSVNSYQYYAGNVDWAKLATEAPNHGTIECVFDNIATTAGHVMCPQTVDSAGTPVADVKADDIIMYKGFMLYGAGPAISWSIAGFPSALPFGTTDFPSKNISIVAPDDTFVSFEHLGDQVVALFEKDMYLAVATGSVPEFTFYRMPEMLGILNATRPEPSGYNGFCHSRHSSSGRGAIYYISNRGLEKLPGGLADEVSAPISTALRSLFGQEPLFVGWDDGADTVTVRKGLGAATPTALVYNVAQGEWNTLLYGPPVGNVVAALTPSIAPKVNSADHTRLIHTAYYETIKTPGVVATNGANIRFVLALLDENSPVAGLVGWEWLTPMIPLGLNYGDYSTGGFIFDAYSLNTSGGAPVTVTWVRYGGSSPYNIFQRETNTITFTGALLSPWVSSRIRYSSKADDAFIMFKLTSTDWVAPVAITLFKSDTQAKR